MDKRYCALFGGPLLIGSGAIELVLRFHGLQKLQCFNCAARFGLASARRRTDWQLLDEVF